LKGNPLRGETYSQILKRQRLPMIEAECTTNVSAHESEKEESNHAVKESAGGKGEENTM
jgi:hypothetical protein